jgi:hypothetical protein
MIIVKFLSSLFEYNYSKILEKLKIKHSVVKKLS